jgi:hypothetical protein
MEIAPLPSILEAVERGRGRRGNRGMRVPEAWVAADRGVRAGAWSWMRAVVLTLLGEGWSYQVVADELAVSRRRVGQLCSEACDAVLRTPASSPEAEGACARIWRSWCDRSGEVEVCARR